MNPYLMLAVAEAGGPAMIPALLDPHADPNALLRAPPSDLPRAALRRLRAADLQRTADAWRSAAARAGHALLTPGCPAYPERLRHAPLRPLVLFARGDPAGLAATRFVCAVGSRTPTAYGRAAAIDFCTTLARAGIGLWSGLASGIDRLAHEACLDHGAPTVAVLAGGLDRVYPAAHGALADRIVAHGGVLLSELPPGARPRRGHFPRRNRILALATDAVLVVEAGIGSGSLHTARFAAEAGVPVFAVPGPYTSDRSRGCHRLIADGAAIASDPADLLRQLGIVASTTPGADVRRAARLELDADDTAILTVLARGPRPADLVLRESRLARDRFLQSHLRLIEQGLVIRLPGDVLARVEGARRV
jgi:DNA processing protein